MNNKPNPDRSLLHFMLRAQQIAQQDGRSDKGYAMLIVSLVSIAMFSMLAAYTTITNLSKSSTKAYVDGTNTFYVAESGLNRRASEIREKFVGYASPSGLSPGQATPTTFVSSANMPNCYSQPVATPATANDFECRNYAYQNTKTSTSFKNLNSNNSFGGSNQTIDNLGQVTNYTAFTFVADKTNFAPGTNPPAPVPVTIPAGQLYAGLNAQVYRYTVYSTAAKPDPLNPTNPVQQSDAKTVLQMDFKSQVIPLFQFAVFYKEDLEMTSTSTMTLSGRVHTNGNLYAQPTPILQPAVPGPTGITTYFFNTVTSAGDIYNRNDASVPLLGTRYSPPRFLQSGNPFTNSPPPVYYPDSNFRVDMSLSTPLSTSELAAFGGQIKDGTAGVNVLTTPDAGFLRKRNYFNNKVGDYYAKADMRLEMVPDRTVNKTATPWTRNSAIIPFNFTSIQTGGSGACTTTLPAAGSDPVNTYIDPTRNNALALRCNVFSKGQLQSLRQPVLVLTNLNQTNAALRTAESATLQSGITLPTLTATPASTALAALAAPDKAKILRALQVALVSNPSPITLDQLDRAFSDTTYNADVAGAMFNGSLNTFKETFKTLINNTHIPTLSGTDRANLILISPNQIAALQNAWFLPAPIQRIENKQPLVQIAPNLRNSGFYDGREKRWITMLQTNLRSLSVWNRDGVYVESADTATDPLLLSPYSATFAQIDPAFNNVTVTTPTLNITTGLAFAQAPAAATTVATCSLSPILAAPGIQRCSLTDLGLGAVDKTEGGLVLHATVNDDLDGNGAIVATDDVTSDSSTPIYKKNPDGTDYINPVTLLRTIVDYPRKYLGGTSGQSPFGFAFNGGDYLPAAMTLVTDQAIYVQGNFNNNNDDQPLAAVNIPSPKRLPAAIMGDTISILSNQCLPNSLVGGVTPTNYLGTPFGQIHCGMPSAATGSVPSGINFYPVTGPTAVNAAFLSSTARSCDNLGANRACGTNPAAYSGGLNNYMRMLEDWGGGTQYFNYSGSFVSLGTPLEYSGKYIGGGTFYNIPRRNYNFEPNFNTFSSLPPLSPSVVSLQQDVFRRAYN